MYLFDTDILSNLLKRAPSPSLIARLAVISPKEQCTSSVALGELVYGAYRQPERTEALLERLGACLFNLRIVRVILLA